MLWHSLVWEIDMLLVIAIFLLCDTVLFLILAGCVSRRNRVRDILIHFLHQVHWLLFVLFPWFAVLLWLEPSARKIHQKNALLYQACVLLIDFGGSVLMFFGAERWDGGICLCAGLLWGWLQILNFLVRHHRNGGNDKADDDSEPQPDSPTPTGDAVDAWLRLLNRQPKH